MAHDPTLRLAQAADREALIALMWRASLTSDIDRPHLLAHPEAVDLPLGHIESGRVIVAETDNTIAGFACLLPCADGACELDGMFVEPDRWRSGVGRRLLDIASDVARREGARAIHVVANQAALAFYHACGFQDRGIAQTRFGPAQTLRKPLAP
jgi:GNAT superfamily N-acetyltransferase